VICDHAASNWVTLDMTSWSVKLQVSPHFAEALVVLFAFALQWALDSLGSK